MSFYSKLVLNESFMSDGILSRLEKNIKKGFFQSIFIFGQFSNIVGRFSLYVQKTIRKPKKNWILRTNKMIFVIRH